MKQLILLICLLFSVHLFANNKQNKTTHTPIKIGYVFSGGGAKGLAHIGVLKVLEELNISPDYITGTSMGSIVGGLYAAGYSAEQLDSIVSTIDWATILSDSYKESRINILERKNYNADFFHLQFNKGEKPSLPAGLIYGHAISTKFSQLTDHVASVRDFDQLSVPFRCMATDLVSAKAVPLNNMPLAKAMRSSMAIPSIFAPVKHDSLLLVDGGVINNFPVEECRKLGASIIIGVNAGFTKSAKPKEYKTITSVLMRAASFMGDESTFEQRKGVDYFIQPDLTTYGVESFGSAKAIIAQGEAAARQPEIYNKLKALAQKLHASNYVSSRKHINKTPNYQFNKIEIQNTHSCKSSFLKNISHLSDSSVNMTNVHTAVTSMYSTNQFNKVTYKIDRDADDYNLLIIPEEKKKGQLSGSLNYSRYKAGMVLQNHFRNWLTPASSLQLRLLISENPRFLAYFRKYSGKNHNINYILSTYFESQQIPNFTNLNDKDISIGYLRQVQIKTNAGVLISPFQNTSLSITASYNHNIISLRGGIDQIYNFDRLSANSWLAEGEFTYNNQDNRYFPSKGVNFQFNVSHSLYSKIDFPSNQDQQTDITRYNTPKLESQLNIALPLTRRISVIAATRAGYHDDKNLFINDFYVGGYMFNQRLNQVNFAGITPNRYSTNRFLKLTAAIQFRLFSVLYFKPEVDHGRFNISYTQGSEKIPGTLTSYGASLGFKSLIGPIQMGWFNNSRLKKGMIVVNIGYPF